MEIFVTYFYRKYGIERPDRIMPGLSIYFKGLKHRYRKMVQDIDINFYEGNKRISFEVYKFIENKLFESENREHMLVHLYFCTRLVSLAWYFFTIIIIFNLFVL